MYATPEGSTIPRAQVLTKPNEGMQATASRVRCAPASGRSSGLAFGFRTIHSDLNGELTK
jgi:hypothetical protein